MLMHTWAYRHWAK